MRFGSFDGMLAARGERTALVFERDGEKRVMTYAELRAAAEKRAGELRAADTGVYGIVCDGSAECVTEIFAAARAGLRFALLGLNADEKQLRAAGVNTLYCDEDTLEDLGDALCPGITQTRPGILFFTSGTVSDSKAVELTESSLCASAYNGGALLPLSEDDLLMCMLPLDHVFGFVCGLLWGLSCGCAVALGRGARHYADDLSFFGPTALSAVPMLTGFLLKNGLLNPGLRLVLIGAGDCPPEIIGALKAKGVRVSFGYGLTETSSGVALSLGDDPYAMTVCPDDRITIADDGEILVSAPTCVMRGYVGDEEATAAVLKDGVLSTGDIGYLDENGLLRITGRKKEMLVLPDGTKLFLPEYERELAAVLPGRDFAVTLTDGSPALLLTGKEEERDAVLAALAEMMRSVPRGKKISAVHFTDRPIPRTATGKIKRGSLPIFKK